MLRPEFSLAARGWVSEPGKLTTAHRGLLLDKYFAPKRASDKEGALPQWKSLCDAALNPDMYKLAYQRWVDFTSQRMAPRVVAFRGSVRNRMAIGLGIENVQEIGCRLHATYGVPVIPGSSLKGLLRAGLSRTADYAAYVTPLFGTDRDEEGAAASGAVEVFDAWWVPPPSGRGSSGLAPDVITVHHGSYYSKEGRGASPQDRESPVPNHFLSVTGEFYFAFRLRMGEGVTKEEEDGWAKFLREAAQSFLIHEGIGGKRSAGYGRFGKFTSVR